MGKGAGSAKRKKYHDKDKYYILAKEQGLRSRAAFKLSQLNRKFPFLQGCRVVLDLCAAPGGWTQIAARTMPRESHIVAVDILPIRPFPRFQSQISTLIGDIATAKCKADISKTLKLVNAKKGDALGGSKGGTADLVLHDGAPNVGASYDKDAYEQNEIAVHALKCATQHLKANGHFVTKVYRSRDYASFLWICQQFFEEVTAFKPKASRAQSAEIFLVCQKYKAPEKIDPRMLDPKHIFEPVDGESTGGKLAVGGETGIHIFHKQWDQKRRQREGYDHTVLDATLRHIQPVVHFVRVERIKDAISLLSTCTGFSFACDKCQSTRGDACAKGKESCHCQFVLRHPLTTPETKACVSDLKVLNKRDFKGLLTWRTKMQEALEAAKGMEEVNDGGSDSNDEEMGKSDDDNDSDNEEADVQAEIKELKQKRQREHKRAKKKERAQAAKRRRQAALGMDLNTIDLPEHSKIFSLAAITSKGHLEAAAEVNLDRVTAEIMPDQEEDEIAVDLDESLQEDKVHNEQDKERGYSFRLDQELDEAYDRYLTVTKDGLARSGTKMEKRKRKSKCINAITEADEDEALLLKTELMNSNDARAYAEMLHGPKGSDDSDGSDDDLGCDDGLYAEPMSPREFAAAKNEFAKEQVDQNPLIHTLGKNTASAKTARWFSNPIFANMGQVAESAASVPYRDEDEGGWGKCMPVVEDEVSDHGQDKGSDSEDKPVEETANAYDKGKKKIPGLKGLDAEEVLRSMPKTDKENRHTKRLKAMARVERKKARKSKKLGEVEAAFEIAPADDDNLGDEGDERRLGHLNAPQRKKLFEARKLIKAGLGDLTHQDLTKNVGFEIVSALRVESPLPALDQHDYGSDKEDYDSDDHAETLALGTMMLRRSKAKALVDASYNRYAWNDPQGLPDWFVDDENKHYRPKLPLPPALIAKIKEKQVALSEKPIKKVAEARARKSKKAKMKLVAAKRKAEAVANNHDMSEAMKLKAISKALRQSDAKRPSKTYVVAKKGSTGAKGIQLVDKRLKSDKRSMERAAAKRKKGKQNKLVGSKKRRHHK